MLANFFFQSAREKEQLTQKIIHPETEING